VAAAGTGDLDSTGEEADPKREDLDSGAGAGTEDLDSEGEEGGESERAAIALAASRAGKSETGEADMGGVGESEVDAPSERRRSTEWFSTGRLSGVVLNGSLSPVVLNGPHTASGSQRVPLKPGGSQRVSAARPRFPPSLILPSLFSSPVPESLLMAAPSRDPVECYQKAAKEYAEWARALRIFAVDLARDFTALADAGDKIAATCEEFAKLDLRRVGPPSSDPNWEFSTNLRSAARRVANLHYIFADKADALDKLFVAARRAHVSTS
jgi:hypothetical protein